MSPRIIARPGIKLPPAVLRSCAGVLSPKLDLLLHRLAESGRQWGLAKSNPKKYLTDRGFNMSQYQELRLVDLPPVQGLIPPLPVKPCPKWTRLVLKKVRDCVCYRWVEGVVAVKVLPGASKPVLAKLPRPILIRFKACLKCGYAIHWEWTCERVIHIFPILPMDRPKTKRPKVPRPRSSFSFQRRAR